MKAAEIIRKVDNLGRVVLPKILMRKLDIKANDGLELYVNGEAIILKKYTPACVICSNIKDVSIYKGRNVCSRCINELKAM